MNSLIAVCLIVWTSVGALVLLIILLGIHGRLQIDGTTHSYGVYMKGGR
jgi:hypothetical protein